MTEPVTPIVGMVNWNDRKNRWDGVVCQVVKDSKGKESILVLDVMHAETEDELSQLLEQSIATRPWLVN